MRISTMTFGALMLAAAAPAFAEDAAPPPAITINGTAAVVTDYRFRGISQTNKNAAIQGSITITHKSGFYVSVWGSSTDDYVTYAGTGHQEIDIIGGYSKTIGGIKFDGGALYYYYPKSRPIGNTSSSDFIEPYFDVSKTFGPVSAKATVNYAPKQKALAACQGDTFTIGCSTKKQDNVYLAGDFSAAIPKTPIGLTAHIGHTFGPSWLATDVNGKKHYTDWALGTTVTYKMLTLGVTYVDTDDDFRSLTGRKVSKGGVVGSLTASF